MKIKTKLKSQSGESIAEVLAAIVIVALATVLFASMVSASERIIRRSDNAYKTNIDEFNAIENYDSVNNNSQKITSTTTQIKISSLDGGDNDLKINNSNAEEKITLYQNSVSNNEEGKKPRFYVYTPVGSTNN